jgi:hypothetical protein
MLTLGSGRENEVGREGGRRKYIRILATSPQQLLQIRGKVVSGILVLYARHPVVFSSAYQNLLGVWGHGPIERFGMVDLQTFRHDGRLGAGACWRGTGRYRGKQSCWSMVGQRGEVFK